MKKILLLILVTFVFNSCVDASPNIEAHNDIHITIDGENLDGFIGEWKITSEENTRYILSKLYVKKVLF